MLKLFEQIRVETSKLEKYSRHEYTQSFMLSKIGGYYMK